MLRPGRPGRCLLKLFVVVNPHAKQNKKRQDLPEKLQRILGPKAEVRVTDSLAALDNIAMEAKEAGCDVLGICGGDGTVHHTLTRFYHVYGDTPLPKVVTLGGGTMNMLMHSIKVLGPSQGIAHRLKAALEKPGALQTVRRETLLVEDKVGFIFGLGLVANFLNAYYEGGNTGPIKAALVLQRAVRSVIQRSEFAAQLFAPWRGTVSVGGRQVPYQEYTALLVQTIENLGIGFAPMYRAFEKPRHFHVIGTQMTPVRLVNHLPEIFFGRPMHHPDTFDETAQELVVTPATDVQFTVDGDMYTSTEPVRVSIGPTIEFLKV